MIQSCAVADWPVFLCSAMHHDVGDLFAVGDTMSWDVVLIDALAAGWPEHVLVDVMATIHPRPRWAHRAAIADAAGIRACWRGSEPPGTTLALGAGLVADVWNPPFRSRITGAVRRIRTVAQARSNAPWILDDVEQAPPRVERDGGLLINLAITGNEILPWS